MDASLARAATTPRGARCDCQHRGGRELGLGSMVNTGELLINVVTEDKPKMLRGLSQKALWIGPGHAPCPGADTISTGGEAGPTLLGYARGTW